MHSLWDYDQQTLKQTEEGQIKILERKINYGPEKGEKILLADVRKYWHKLQLFPLQKRLLELLLWGKYQTSQKSSKSFSAK